MIVLPVIQNNSVIPDFKGLSIVVVDKHLFAFETPNRIKIFIEPSDFELALY